MIGPYIGHFHKDYCHLLTNLEIKDCSLRCPRTLMIISALLLRLPNLEVLILWTVLEEGRFAMTTESESLLRNTTQCQMLRRVELTLPFLPVGWRTLSDFLLGIPRRAECGLVIGEFITSAFTAKEGWPLVKWLRTHINLLRFTFTTLSLDPRTRPHKYFDAEELLVVSLRIHTTRNRILNWQTGADVQHVWKPVDELLKAKWSMVRRCERRNKKSRVERNLFWISAYCDLAYEWALEEWNCHDETIVFLLLSERVITLNQLCLPFIWQGSPNPDKMPLTTNRRWSGGI
jgi:hypothetical protein